MGLGDATVLVDPLQRLTRVSAAASTGFVVALNDVLGRQIQDAFAGDSVRALNGFGSGERPAMRDAKTVAAQEEA